MGELRDVISTITAQRETIVEEVPAALEPDGHLDVDAENHRQMSISAATPKGSASRECSELPALLILAHALDAALNSGEPRDVVSTITAQRETIVEEVPAVLEPDCHLDVSLAVDSREMFRGLSEIVD